eukprot:357857-Rhodomonas_salina.1
MSWGRRSRALGGASRAKSVDSARVSCRWDLASAGQLRALHPEINARNCVPVLVAKDPRVPGGEWTMPSAFDSPTLFLTLLGAASWVIEGKGHHASCFQTSTRA